MNDRRAVRAIAIGVLQVLRLVPGFARAAVIENQFGTLKEEDRCGRREEG